MMISLVEAMKTSSDDLPTIYCDMDQVLCDFINGATNAIGAPFVTADKNTRWQSIIDAGSKFWSGLNWMSGGKKLYQFIGRYDPKILSAYSDKMAAESKKGKMDWLKKNTKIKRSDTYLVLRDQKKKFAMTSDGKPNVLIDDYQKNIDEWEAAGGIGITHFRTEVTIQQLKKIGFK